MSFRIVPFTPEHLLQFKNFGGQDGLVTSIDEKDLIEFKDRGESCTLMRNEAVIACAGVINCNKFRGVAWGLFQRLEGTEFVAIHRAALAGMKRSGLSRIEAFVDPKFYQAMRWIKMLGFQLERAYIPFFFPDGSGASAWAWHPES